MEYCGKKIIVKSSKRLKHGRYSVRLLNDKIILTTSFFVSEAAIIPLLEKIPNLKRKLEKISVITLPQGCDLLEGNVVKIDNELALNIKKVYKKIIIDTQNMLKKINKNVDLIKFKKVNSYFGKYNRQKNFICFNTFLYRLPENLWHAVVCHEVSHTIVFNHSKNFYNLLLKLCPYYKMARKELKKYTGVVSKTFD